MNNLSVWLARFSVASLSVVAGCVNRPSDAIARTEAERLTLQRVPGGHIVEAELEREGGRWVWSLDLTTPGTTEVYLDARTGAVVAIETETAEHEAKEKVDR